MALTTLDLVRAVPGMGNVVKLPDAYLNTLIAATTETIKKYAKQNLELQAYTEYYNGTEQPDIVLRQFPVWAGTTQIAAGSNGVALPTATINVVTTLAPDGSSMFDPAGRASGQSPVIAIQTSLTTWTTVSYTGTTSTSFTGCSGGTGTMSSANGLNGVSQPVVFFDPVGYSGQAQPNAQGTGPFAAGTLQVMGTNFMIPPDLPDGVKSMRGLLRRIGGYGPYGGNFGYWPQNMGGGKLSSYRLPCWPRGYGNVKVQYSAGFDEDNLPADLQYAATTLVAAMVRNQPKGAELGSESLGAYSYNILSGSQDPDIGSVRQILTRYREVGW